jgi:hypothetical protein
MLVKDVYSYFDRICDEQDNSRLTPTMIQEYLRAGYDEFRRVVSSYDPNVYATRAVITLAGVTSYDLALAGNPVRLLGATPTQAPLQQLLKVISIDPTTLRAKWPWRGVKHEEELDQANVYQFQGTLLDFGYAVSDTLRLVYIPCGSKPRNATGVDWSKYQPADNEFIDDLDGFHDMIALYAYGLYAATNDASSQQVFELLDRRLKSLQKFLFNGRDSDAAGHTSRTY